MIHIHSTLQILPREGLEFRPCTRLSSLPFRFPITLLPQSMAPTFPKGFLSPTGLQPCLHLWSSHRNEQRGSAHKGTDYARFCLSRLENWHQAFLSNSLLATPDPILLFFVITQTTYFPHLGDSNQNTIFRKTVDAVFYDAMP